MTAVSSALPGLPPVVLDRMLRVTPIDVLLFDSDLMCQYVAPAADTFLGEPPERLLGRPVVEVLPPATNGLRSVLEDAAHGRSGWRHPRYQFSCQVGGVDTDQCAAILVEPIALPDAGFQGVLVILADAQELRRVIEERDQLREETGRLRRALRELQVSVRNRLAPVSGFLQLLARRPYALGGQTGAAVLLTRVLPQLAALVGDIDARIAVHSRSSDVNRQSHNLPNA